MSPANLRKAFSGSSSKSTKLDTSPFIQHNPSGVSLSPAVEPQKSELIDVPCTVVKPAETDEASSSESLTIPAYSAVDIMEEEASTRGLPCKEVRRPLPDEPLSPIEKDSRDPDATSESSLGANLCPPNGEGEPEQPSDPAETATSNNRPAPAKMQTQDDTGASHAADPSKVEFRLASEVCYQKQPSSAELSPAEPCASDRSIPKELPADSSSQFSPRSLTQECPHEAPISTEGSDQSQATQPYSQGLESSAALAAGGHQAADVSSQECGPTQPYIDETAVVGGTSPSSQLLEQQGVKNDRHSAEECDIGTIGSVIQSFACDTTQENPQGGDALASGDCEEAAGDSHNSERHGATEACSGSSNGNESKQPVEAPQATDLCSAEVPTNENSSGRSETIERENISSSPCHNESDEMGAQDPSAAAREAIIAERDGGTAPQPASSCSTTDEAGDQSKSAGADANCFPSRAEDGAESAETANSSSAASAAGRGRRRGRGRGRPVAAMAAAAASRAAIAQSKLGGAGADAGECGGGTAIEVQRKRTRVRAFESDDDSRCDAPEESGCAAPSSLISNWIYACALV